MTLNKSEDVTTHEVYFDGTLYINGETNEEVERKAKAFMSMLLEKYDFLEMDIVNVLNFNEIGVNLK